MLSPVKSEPHLTYVQPALPIRKIMFPFPWSAGLSAVTVAEPQPSFVTLASVSLSAELVKPHWPLAAAVNSAICVALAGPAVTGEADGTAGDRPGLADGELATGLAVVALGVGVALRPAAADDVELAPLQAAARHKMPAVSPARTAGLACRRMPGSSYAISLFPRLLFEVTRHPDQPSPVALGFMVSRPARQMIGPEVLSKGPNHLSVPARHSVPDGHEGLGVIAGQHADRGTEGVAKVTRLRVSPLSRVITTLGEGS